MRRRIACIALPFVKAGIIAYLTEKSKPSTILRGLIQVGVWAIDSLRALIPECPANLKRGRMQTPPNEITQLLRKWSEGDRAALNELMPVVYQELRKLAGGYLRGEKPGHTLQPTALINEAYLRLVKQDFPEWQSRKHFYGVAAQLMRQILVEHARARATAKRGDGAQKISLDEAPAFSQERAADLVALDDALTALADFDERKARVVELRYFGGLSVEEVAGALDISVATVGREMRMAQAWLRREMAK
jgi:RNA polymerase sigma-70 factor, ECF subfamily